MGYFLFASRKIYWQNMINNLNLQLDNIVQEKANLLSYSAGISDGTVEVMDLVQDPVNFDRYLGFIQGSDAYKKNAEGAGRIMDTVGGFLANDKKEYTANDVKAIAELLDVSLGSEYAKQCQKALAAEENQLDLQQKRIETKLEAAKKQLDSVQQAEAQAIQNATPKFAGLG